MPEDMWRNLWYCLRRNASVMAAVDRDAPSGRLEGEFGGESYIRAYPRIWFCLEASCIPDVLLLRELLTLLQAVEGADMRAFRPWFHLFLLCTDDPFFFHRKDLVLAYNTNTGIWAEQIIRDAREAFGNVKNAKGRTAAESGESRLQLGQSRLEDLVVFAADWPLERVKGWAAVVREGIRMSNVLCASLTAEAATVSFEKISCGQSREDVYIYGKE